MIPSELSIAGNYTAAFAGNRTMKELQYIFLNCLKLPSTSCVGLFVILRDFLVVCLLHKICDGGDVEVKTFLAFCLGNLQSAPLDITGFFSIKTLPQDCLGFIHGVTCINEGCCGPCLPGKCAKPFQTAHQWGENEKARRGWLCIKS